MWLTTGYSHLSLKAPLCWEQLNHTKHDQPRNIRKLGWVPYEQCLHIITLRDCDWYGTDWVRRPEIHWVAPNGTQWICGTNLWPWLPPGWIGRCTLGFPWTQGHIRNNLEMTPANLPLVRALWVKRSVFHWYDHFAAIFAPSIGLEDVIGHIEALAKFTQQALNDCNEAVSLLNSEVSTMRKAVLQSRLALDILTASQGGTCAMIQTERRVLTPDESSDRTRLMNHMQTQISALVTHSLVLTTPSKTGLAWKLLA